MSSMGLGRVSFENLSFENLSFEKIPFEKIPFERIPHVGIAWLFAVAFSLGVLYYTSLAVYNVFFHPLRNFPGPTLAAMTSLYWGGWYNIRGRKNVANEMWHKKYGDVVRVTPNQLSFIGETAWKDIYAHRQGRAQFQKEGRGRPVNGAYSIINAPDDIHARQRKMVSHAFSDRALREQEPLLKTYVDLLISNLHDDAQNNRQVDMVSAFNFTTFDIIGDFCFAEPFHNLSLRRPHPWMAGIFRGIRFFVMMQTMTQIPLVRTLFLYFIRMMTAIKAVPNNIQFARERVTKRIDSGDGERPDLMTNILRYNGKNGEDATISRAEIDATVSLLIIAGSETTATLLSGCMNLLLRNPDKFQILKDEIRGAFESADDITLARLNQLPYLLAVLEESLRLYPPVPVALPRVVIPEGASICGHWVPGGTIVGIPQQVAFRAPEHFVEPLSFLPERFLPERDPKFDNDSKAILQPFSTGPRNCVGKNLAYAEMKLILSRVLYDFDIQMVDESKKWEDQRVFVLYEKSPLMVWLKERC